MVFNDFLGDGARSQQKPRTVSGIAAEESGGRIHGIRHGGYDIVGQLVALWTDARSIAHQYLALMDRRRRSSG